MFYNAPVNIVRHINLARWELQHLFNSSWDFLNLLRYERDELSGQTRLGCVMDWRHVQFYGTWETPDQTYSMFYILQM